eukprot:CAMPEP_0119505060 /NCGR_PEP_ID=MMETSP1344-20130328/25717_1 /TAXON_ID=236787 /ORGANISM="Florenciella parvula, Strain CCMP2471" /LENGTH=38 /DNA_ID= /DNA_START= /DNA_END= /DNA_ORIENTATION=
MLVPVDVVIQLVLMAGPALDAVVSEVPQVCAQSVPVLG